MRKKNLTAIDPSEPPASQTDATDATPQPSDRRESRRVKFYRGEFPEAKIHIGEKTYPAEVFDLSSNGIGIVPKVEIPGLDTVSQKVFVTLGSASPRSAILRNVSHIKFAGSLRLKLGLHTPDWDRKDSLKEELFSCSDCMPMAYCQDPVAFNRTILFNVSHFSKSGLVLRTKFIEGAFFPGLIMEIRLMMPARGEFKAVVEVKEMQHPEDRAEIFCTWRQGNPEMLNSVSEFLLMNVPDLTIKDLKDGGFLVADLEKALIFKYSQGPDDFERILKLRLIAAKGEGRWLDTEDHRVTQDKWDSYARQIYCEVNGKVVAAARIVFNNGLRERSEHVSYNVDIPKWLWEDGFVEGSRVCTDPAFRGTDVFLRIVQQISNVVLQSGHRYLVMNCVDKLVPVYKNAVGVVSLDKRFHTPFMQKDALNLFYVDVRNIQVGVNAKPKSWVVHTPVGNHSIKYGNLALSWWERGLRVLLFPLHMAFRRIDRKRRFKKAAHRLAS